MVETAVKIRFLEYVSCNLCGSREVTPVCSAPSNFGPEVFQVVRCRGCGLVYVNPRGNTDLTVARRTTTKLKPPTSLAIARCRVVLRKIGRYAKPDGSFLDFGCSYGGLVGEAQHAGWDAWGVELNPAVASAARDYWKTDRIITGNFEQLRIPFAGVFTVVNASQVFEHLPDPLGTARAILDVLKPGGLLSIDVPNVDGITYWMRGKRAYDPTAHLYHFSARTLPALLEKAGYYVLEARTSFSSVRLAMMAVRDPECAAVVSHRLYRLPLAGFGLNVIARKA